jgi:diguanylate cyclase (GGDEF)-like protein/PAS domain S-box-containing protein
LTLLMSYVQRQETERIRQDFSDRVSRWFDTVEGRAADCLDPPGAISRWVEASGQPPADRFADFVAWDLTRRPEIHALGWDPLVTAEERPDFERGRPGRPQQLPIRERSPAGALVEAAPRAWHAPVEMISPLEPNRAALGFDVSAEPVRREALERAIRTRKPAMTGSIQLVQMEEERPGVLLFVPAIAPSVADASEGGKVLGFGTLVLVVEELLAPPTTEADLGITLSVMDTTEPGRAAPLVGWGTPWGGGEASAAALDEEVAIGERLWQTWVGKDELGLHRTLELAGRTWEFSFEPTSSYLRAQATYGPRVVMAVTLSGASLLSLLLLLSTGHEMRERRRASELGQANRALTEEARKREEATAALQVERDRAAVTLHSIADAVIRTGPDGRVEYLNPVAQQLTGWGADEGVGAPLDQVFVVVDETTGERFQPGYLGLDERRSRPAPRELTLTSRQGDRRVVRASRAPIGDDVGKPRGYVLAFNDVTVQRRMAREVEFQARHDALTGLANRREFERLAAKYLAGSAEGAGGAIAFLDLDQFKVVNDTFGHAAGDELLRLVAGALASQLRETDTLARLGGDEFGLLLDGCEIDLAETIASRLVDTVSGLKFGRGGRSVPLGVSIGLVELDGRVRDVSELLSRADIACYAAKALGRNQVRRYDPQDEGDEGARGQNTEPVRSWPQKPAASYRILTPPGSRVMRSSTLLRASRRSPRGRRFQACRTAPRNSSGFTWSAVGTFLRAGSAAR